MEITEALETIINARYGRDVRQAIHDGIKRAYEDAIKNGNANMEVSQARGSYPSLAERLIADFNKLNSDKISKGQVEASDLMQSVLEIFEKRIAKGQVTMADLTQEVKEALTGGSVPIVGEGAVGWMNVGNTLKTILDGISQNRTYFKFVMGGVDADNPSVPNENKDPSKGILEQVYINMKAGETIVLDDPAGTYQLSVVVHEQLRFLDGWNTRQYTAPKDELVSIQVRRTDGESANFDDMATHFYLIKPLDSTLIKDGAITIEKLNTEIENYIKDVSQGYEDFPPLVSGTLDVSKSPIEHLPNEAYTRAILASLEPIQLHDGDKIILTDTHKYQIAFGVEGLNVFPNLWNDTEYTAVGDQLVSPMFKMTDAYKESTDNQYGILDLEDVQASVKIKRNIFGAIDKGAITRYVTLNGKDTNDGSSASSGYATLARALKDNPTKILVEKGTYYGVQPSSISNVDNLTISAFGGDVDEKALFIGGKYLTFQPDGNVYSSAYGGNEYYNAVFVSKTTPTMTSGTRPSPNAVLWEVYDDVKHDYKMKPVLTLAEVEAEKGTFYFDGTKIYINPQDINNKFLVTESRRCLNVSGKNVNLIDVEAKGFHVLGFDLNNIDNLVANRVNASHSGQHNGFNLNYTNAVFNDCYAIKNRNDGFNMHYKGHTVFNNCHGWYNYDDGISHHETCTGFINGGTWIGNGKGGISPVQDVEIAIQNAICEDNKWAIWNNTNSEIDTTYSNCLFKNNDNGIQLTTEGSITLINCVEVGNGEDNVASPDSVKRY